jgi:hypothetical protein
VALIHSMRLPLMKGACADRFTTAWQEIGGQAEFGLRGIPQHATSLFYYQEARTLLSSTTTYVAFLEESRIWFTETTRPDRKSGERSAVFRSSPRPSKHRPAKHARPGSGLGIDRPVGLNREPASLSSQTLPPRTDFLFVCFAASATVCPCLRVDATLAWYAPSEFGAWRPAQSTP